jgi:LmbE family N-acetylglucosaminyl deacetylase
VNALRRLQPHILLFPNLWDTHADHRNLSAAMKDVVYYVGHRGMAFDAPPAPLRSAWMFTLEADTEELHHPDLLFDVTDTMEQKIEALADSRVIFGNPPGPLENVRVLNRYWGMRCGTVYAEPLYQTWGSMHQARLTLDRYRVTELPMTRGSGQGPQPRSERP